MTETDAESPQSEATPDPVQATEEPEPPVLAADPRTLLLVKLGHPTDPETHITGLLNAQAAFEGGNYKGALGQIETLMTLPLSDVVRHAAHDIERRIRPDPIALWTALVCAAGLVLIWYFAIHAAH